MSFYFLSRGHAPTYQWAQYTVSGSSKGSLVGYVRSNFPSDYPSDGAQGGYWYVRIF